MNSTTPQILKQITPELLDELQRLSSLMFSAQEIAIIMEIDPDEFKDILESDPENRGSKAFHGSRLKREAALRQAIFDLAENGSSPAQTMAWRIIENAKIDQI